MMTVLVANRGEIASRVIRTARRLGFRTVAVYSDADADLPFAREADAAIRLGPAPARQSYLDRERVVAAARDSGAQLVHPGYGFLAEDPLFARAVADAGLRFVGPPEDVLRALGDKGEAKRIAESVGVPVVPGYRGADQRDDAFATAARATGYPVMVKPAAGGGGIGMQLVADPRGLPDALARARRVAGAAFADERLILEHAIEGPRHIEVQILCDDHGAVIALGARDCSLQRRHQKVIEESAPLRDDLADAARRIAGAAAYRGAGTVEFLVDRSGAFFFLEVNARLQVEHPVTEAVTGVDLVQQQLRIALGERVTIAATTTGHAIEARLYAEDPPGGFVPSIGRLAHVRWPEGLRVDAGYEEGSAVTRHYDPLVAKLIAHGDTREATLAALDRGLAETEILGVRTNLAFLRALLAHSAVRAGEADTELIDREVSSLTGAGEPASPGVYALAAVAALESRPRVPRDPWSTLGAWRVGEGLRATIVLRDGATERAIEVTGAGPWTSAGLEISRDDEPHRWRVGGEPATAARSGTAIWVGDDGATFELETGPRERDIASVAGGEVDAPMPGVVLSIAARADQPLKRGDLICIIEAMKMELRVTAPVDGIVRRMLCAAGDQVRRGQRLADFEATT